jgi:CHAD domain-containing protein
VLPAQVQLAVPSGIGTDQIALCAASAGTIKVEPTAIFQVEYRDTFDRRLFRAKQVLEHQRREGCPVLVWRALRRGTTLGIAACADSPDLASDLPPGPMRARIASTVWIRRMLPVVDVLRRETQLLVCNTDGKTVARLLLQEDSPADSAGAPARCHRRLWVIPVRGYLDAHAKVLAAIAEGFGLERVDVDPLCEALRSINPIDRCGAPAARIVLEPSMPVSEALRGILLRHSQTIQNNVEGVVEDWDSEFLHDLRVAVRRTRTLLRQYKRHLPASLIERYEPQFRWLGQATGPARDLDVHLLDFQAYLDIVPCGVRPDLEPLRTFLITKRRAAQSELCAALRAPRFRSLMCDWTLRLQDPFEPMHEGERTARTVADRSVRRAFKRVLRRSRAIGPESPPAAMHRLRMNCKKLRYSIEFFAPLYPRERTKALIGNLKSLQDNLGCFHDCEVQERALRAFSEEMMIGGDARAPTLLAMGCVIDAVQRRQQDARTEFAARLAAFDSPDNRRDYRRSFKTPGRAKARS